jgi:hypothetical protein
MAYMSSIPLNTEHMMEQINGKGTHTKQAHFARCVAQGMTQADAYREAYDPKAGNHCGKHSHTGKQADGTG